jgi:hypothetical protein
VTNPKTRRGLRLTIATVAALTIGMAFTAPVASAHLMQPGGCMGGCKGKIVTGRATLTPAVGTLRR